MELVRNLELWEDILQVHGYELLGLLDSGSFSDVFAVRKKSTSKSFAIKRIVARHSITSDPTVLAEISCLTQLRMRSPYVVKLEEAILLERAICLVLELAPMGNLERHVQQNWPVSETLVKFGVGQLLSAMTHCHRLDLAHRDLNPANILLAGPHSIRLADFGLAVRCCDSRGRRIISKEYLGRESYMAPEVHHKSPYFAIYADLWSMGCICYFLLTGNHPQIHQNVSSPNQIAYTGFSSPNICGGVPLLIDTTESRDCVRVPVRRKTSVAFSSLVTCSSQNDFDHFIKNSSSQCEFSTIDTYSPHVTLDVNMDENLDERLHTSLEAQTYVTNDFVANRWKTLERCDSQDIGNEFSLAQLVSRFCNLEPSMRLQTQDALTFWRSRISSNFEV